jgi:hypothetical protein
MQRFSARENRCLKPGSYIEHCKLGIVTHCDDGSVPEDHAAKVCMELVTKAMTTIGIVAISNLTAVGC